MNPGQNLLHLTIEEIQASRNRILSLNIDPVKKEELLNKLDRLRPGNPEHDSSCKCKNCNKGFTDTDEPEIVQDKTVLTVFKNIKNPLITRIMNKKVTAFIVIGVGIAIAVIGFKMWQKNKSAAAPVA